MVMSLHRFDKKTFFPGREDGKPQSIGSEEGKGFNVNVAWNTGTWGICKLGAHEYKLACEEVLFPIAKEFKPDLIIVSCGFDSAIHDKLGGAKLCPLGYYWMTRQLLKICQRMVVVLEGGYNTDFLGQHASGVVNALLDVKPSDMEATQADKDAEIKQLDIINGEFAKDWAKKDVEETKECLKPFWKSL